ncbi:hypothetical protein C3L33_23365, partial [Rhododendron williamsianum]
MAKRGVNKKSCSGPSPPPPRNRRANIAAAAATTISELPNDVIFDILVRIPDIKSVIRCKQVCKKWRNLILQPCFAKSQSSRGFLPPSLIFYSLPDVFANSAHFSILELDDDLDRLGRQNATITFRSGIYMPHERYKRLLKCNGLVYGKPVQIKGGIPSIVLCNPGAGASFKDFLDKGENSWPARYNITGPTIRTNESNVQPANSVQPQLEESVGSTSMLPQLQGLDDIEDIFRNLTEVDTYLFYL